MTKKLLQNPTFIDRTTITFANGATHTIELDNKAMGDDEEITRKWVNRAERRSEASCSHEQKCLSFVN